MALVGLARPAERKDENGVVRLEGTQSNFEGTLKIKGEVLSIGSDRFVCVAPS